MLWVFYPARWSQYSSLNSKGRFMSINNLLNHRVSYQVMITFDLSGAKSSKYPELRAALANELELKTDISLSKEDGGQAISLPHNTLAVLWEKDTTEQETRTYFKKKILAVFKAHNLHGRYVILIAQNWAVAADEF